MSVPERLAEALLAACKDLRDLVVRLVVELGWTDVYAGDIVELAWVGADRVHVLLDGGHTPMAIEEVLVLCAKSAVVEVRVLDNVILPPTDDAPWLDARRAAFKPIGSSPPHQFDWMTLRAPIPFTESNGLHKLQAWWL